MLMPILWTCTLIMEFMVVIGAPKLGYVLFDPLSYEAEKFEQIKAPLMNTNTTNTTQEENITPASDTLTTVSTEKITPSTTHLTDIITNANKSENVELPNKLSYNYFKLIENALDVLRKQPKTSKSLRIGDSIGPKTKEPCAEYEYNGKICKFINNRLLCGYDKNKGELKNDEFVDIGNRCRMHRDRIECGYATGPFNNPRRPPAQDEHINENETTNSVKNPARLGSDQTTTTGGTPDTKTSEPESLFKTDTTSVTQKPVKTTLVTTYSTTLMSTTKATKIPIQQKQIVTTKITQTTTKIPELVITPKLNEVPEYATNLVTSQGNVTSTVKNSPHSSKVTRSIRSSIAETVTDKTGTVDTTPAALVTKQPKRWCVEKNDRIVCYYL